MVEWRIVSFKRIKSEDRMAKTRRDGGLVSNKLVETPKA